MTDCWPWAQSAHGQKCRRRESKAPAEERSEPDSAAILEGKGDDPARPVRDKAAIAGGLDGELDGVQTAGDPVEAALVDALTRASAAGQWGVVSELAKQLDARRLARAGAVDLRAERAKRGVS